MFFILSFSIMHDTVIHTLDDNTKLSLSEYVQNMQQTNDVSDIQNIHDIFHYIALMPLRHISVEPLRTADGFLDYMFQYTLPLLQNSTKPPIA